MVKQKTLIYREAGGLISLARHGKNISSFEFDLD
jgi:hypothetical protein